MAREIYLEFNYKGKVHSIPCNTLEELDSFTEEFSNKEELIKYFNATKDFPANETYVRVKYVSPKPSKGTIRYTNLDVVYKEDIFDEEALLENLKIFLMTYPKEVYNKKWKVIFILDNMSKKRGNDQITDNDIIYACDKLWEGGYKRQRDIYFSLKKVGIKTRRKPIKSAKIITSGPQLNRMDYFDSDNEYYEYLKEYATRGDEEAAFAMDEIAKFDFSHVYLTKNSDKYESLFDGIECYEKPVKKSKKR